MAQTRTLERAALAAWAVVLLFLFLPASPAQAHETSQFWEFEWSSQDRGTTRQHFSVTEQVPGTTADATWPTRVWNGAVRWNNWDISGPDMAFGIKPAIVSDYSPWDACSTVNFSNGLHYRATLNDNAASTTLCLQNTFFGWQIREYHMVFHPDELWYTGSNPDGPAEYLDLVYVASHEFGHVVGGWTGGTPGGHYDSVNNSLLCGTAIPMVNRHTMCASASYGPSQDQRSLEQHDVDVFIQSYPP